MVPMLFRPRKRITFGSECFGIVLKIVLTVQALWLCFWWLRLAFGHCIHPLLYRLVSRSYYVLAVIGSLADDNRKPLGNPNPAVANLALAIVLMVVVVLQTAFVRGSRIPDLLLMIAECLAGLLYWPSHGVHHWHASGRGYCVARRYPKAHSCCSARHW
jgi:hypothetical protein